MEIVLKYSGNKEKITEKNFLASGGEANIYAKNSVVYKIYTNKNLVIPEAKIKELSVLSNPDIIKPLDVILDNKAIPIGYTMRYLKDTEPLCKLFTKTFKAANKIDNSKITQLVNKFRDMVSECHKEKILIVDLNELNFLVQLPKFDHLYFIDTNSYQTPSFPATVIMDNIRDRHSNGYNEKTDWFSFAILTFQMFVGIHPYKGNHPCYTDKTTSLDLRMKNNISVFNTDVTLPASVLPFNVIPTEYRDWYYDMFEKGIRTSPPYGTVQSQKSHVIFTPVISTKTINIVLVGEFKANIIDYKSFLDSTFVVTEKGIEQPRFNKGITTFIYIEPLKKIISLEYENGELKMVDVFENIINTIRCNGFMIYNNRIFVLTNDNIQEIDILVSGNSLLFSYNNIANALSFSTKFYDGIAIQNLLGTYFVSVFPFKNIHHQVRIPELSGYRILDAVYRNKVLIIIAEKNSKYDKFVLKFFVNFSS